MVWYIQQKPNLLDIIQSLWPVKQPARIEDIYACKKKQINETANSAVPIQ
jgi:hypothetical protein